MSDVIEWKYLGTLKADCVQYGCEATITMWGDPEGNTHLETKHAEGCSWIADEISRLGQELGGD